MRLIALTLALAFATPVAAQTINRPVATLSATLSGQSVPVPPAPVVVKVSELTVPPGEVLAPHKHPYLRIVEVMAGELEIRFPDTGKSRIVKKGDWVVDSFEEWHTGTVLGTEPVVMRVIDILPPGAMATIVQPAKP